MQNENHLLKFTMTYGLYLGIAFSAVVMLLHLSGQTHSPGGNAGFFNTLILVFTIIYLGRKYKTTFTNNQLTYGQALGFSVLLSVFSAFIFSFFAYFYYARIEPEGINFFIQQIEASFNVSQQFSQTQRDAILELYKTGLTPGTMAFLVGFYQTLVGIAISLLTAIFIKTPLKPTQL